MGTAVPRLGVVYEHPEWFAPLFAELDRRGVPYDRIDVTAHAFDPAVRKIPWTIVLNRMSPSAHLRGHGQAIIYAREFLRYMEAAGALRRADRAWLERLITRRVPLDHWHDALERRPDDVKVVIDFTV